MSEVIYFVITIGILVFIHEFGHFASAKLCGMRAEIFALGFGKRLFGYNKITGFTFGDLAKDFDGQGNTDYRISLIPLGGYVKISGMVDESFDTAFIGKTPEPYEFRAKPTTQKVFVITAGVIMNILLALMIFWGGNYFQGKEYWKTTTIGFIAPKSGADQAGFKSNDKALTINGKKVTYWEDVNSEIYVNANGNKIPFTILRDGKEIKLDIDRSLIPSEKTGLEFLTPANLSPAIGDVLGKSPAHKAGIKTGDILLELKGSPLLDATQTTQIISSNKNTPLPLRVLRGKDTLNLTVVPGADGKIGISLKNLFTGQIEYHTYGFFASFYYGAIDIYKVTSMTLTMLRKVVTGNLEFSKAFGGPIKIAQYASKFADSGIASFLTFLALLSLSLATINILPFPALDGGHFVIIVLEGIFKKEIPIKIKIAIQNTGFVLLLILMLFIVYNDILNM